eukprot:m.132162 g.132162  ORF g.132162 m.132162 type:complete len:293 (+) comp9828_c0_seq1:1818-2696(+)
MASSDSAAALPPLELGSAGEDIRFCYAASARAEAALLHHEIFVQRAYLQHGLVLPAGSVVLDVGANIGLFALHCLHEAPDVSVVCVEPIPANCAILALNLAGFESSSWSLIRAAVGARPSRVPRKFFYFPLQPGEATQNTAERRDTQRRTALAAEALVNGSDGNNDAALEDVRAQSRAAQEQKPVECFVRVTTISDILAEKCLGTIDLLKVDCEGDEERALLGIRDEDWPRIRQVVVEVADRRGRLGRITALLQRHGFHTSLQQQQTQRDGDFLVFVPAELELYHVYARRLD